MVGVETRVRPLSHCQNLLQRRLSVSFWVLWVWNPLPPEDKDKDCSKQMTSECLCVDVTINSIYCSWGFTDAVLDALSSSLHGWGVAPLRDRGEDAGALRRDLGGLVESS